MRLDEVVLTFVSRKPARVARWVVFLAPFWMIFGSVGLSYLGFRGELVAVNVFASFLGFLVAAVVALAFGGATELGVLRSGQKGAISVATGGMLARLGERELSDRVVSGVREEVAGVHQLVLELQSGDALVVGARDAAEGEAVLDAAGVGMRQRALALRIGRVQGAILRSILATLFLASLLVGLPSMLGFLATLVDAVSPHPHSHTASFLEAFGAVSTVAGLTLFFTGRALAVRTIQIGHDGVLVQSSRFFRTFVPFEGLQLRRVGSRIGLRSGTLTARIAASNEDEAAILVQHIERAQAAHARRDQLGASVLARNGRSLDAWSEELAALVERQGYRAALGRGELVAVAEDPRAPSDQRVGATYALATLPKDAPERERLRVVIETTANPKLRVALEHAAEGTIDGEALDAADALKNS